MNTLKTCVSIVCCGLVSFTVKAQLIERTSTPTNKTAVPFLLLSTDAISSGMGEAGSALLSSTSTAEINAAKASFLDEKFNVNVTYTPWLRKLVSDRKLLFLGGFYKISPKLTLTASLNYLSYGQTDLIDVNQVSFGTIQPVEYVGALGISKSFSSKFSLGMKLKVVHSNLYTGSDANVGMQTGNAYAIDLSAYHLFPLHTLLSNSKLAVAINIENVGPKISYFNQSNQKSYLPGNLRIGTAFKTETSVDDEIGLAIDFNKMLVPFNQSEPNESVMTSLLSSFNRKSGFKLTDISLSIGAEYVHKKTIAFRAGYNLQGDERLPGNFFSTGLGVKVKKVSLNMAYVFGNPQRTFLSNTLRLTMGYSLPNNQ